VQPYHDENNLGKVLTNLPFYSTRVNFRMFKKPKVAEANKYASIIFKAELSQKAEAEVKSKHRLNE